MAGPHSYILSCIALVCAVLHIKQTIVPPPSRQNNLHHRSLCPFGHLLKCLKSQYIEGGCFHLYEKICLCICLFTTKLAVLDAGPVFSVSPGLSEQRPSTCTNGSMLNIHVLCLRRTDSA